MVFKGKRLRLVEELSQNGIKDNNVLNAILKVPRHFFFPRDFINKAYLNAAFPIGHEQTISQPYTVAFQTQLLKLQQGMKILEIGTGSGYQAAILNELGGKVYTIECVNALYQQSKMIFNALNYPISSYFGDGSLGLPSEAPFDRILLTAATPDNLTNFVHQLKIGGKLVAPVGSLDVQKMLLIEKTGDDSIRSSEHGNFKFVPLTGKHGWNI
jgi:protein-L-isoaspartate(D-aspartate) O-methyltransferase